MRSTLQRQTTNAFFIAAVVPLVLVCAALSVWFLAGARQELQDRLDQSSAALLSRLDLYLEEHQEAIATLAALLEGQPERRDRESVGEWLAILDEKNDGFLTSLVADPAGQIVAGAPRPDFEGLEGAELTVADRDYFQRADEAPEPYLSGAFRGRGVGNDPLVAISQGFAWGDGRRGVLEGSLDLSRLERMVREGAPATSWSVLLLDPAGAVVASNSDGFSMLQRIDPAFTGSEAHSAYLIAQATSAGTGWQVLALAERASLHGPLRVFGGAIAIALLISALVASWLFRRLQFPVISWITDVSRRFSTQEIEAIRVPPLPSGAAGELVGLGDALGELLATVRRQRGQLTDHLAGLEVRVQERTAAVESINRELSHSRALLEQFVRQAPVSIALFDREMRFLAVSDRWLEAFELGARELVGQTFVEVLPELPERWRERHQRCIEGEAQRVEEEPLPRADGSIQWMRWAMDPWESSAGAIAGSVMMAEFVTEEKRLRDQLRHLADHDSLTGLMNRRVFLDLLERTLGRPEDLAHVLLFVDLDEFKDVNDRLGHHTGDDVLRLFGDKLRRHARATDVVARLGGDEFVVLSRVARDDEVPALVERYRKLLSFPVRSDRGEMNVTVSLGALRLRPGMQVESALDGADQAMYTDKRSRRREGTG